jgi:hypothetical protein
MASLLWLVCLAVATATASDEGPPIPVDTGAYHWKMNYTHTDSEAGISWYTHQWRTWPLGKPANWGVGKAGTWLHGNGINFDAACGCNPLGWPNNPKVRPDQANYCCGSGNKSCSFLFETIEGGAQDDERWRAGANVGCFSFKAGVGLFNYGGGEGSQHPCGQIAFASLSNRMVMQPNGMSFEQDGVIGTGYVRTPLGKTSADDDRSFVTLVSDTETFAGPLGYYLPEFWAGRDTTALPGGTYPYPKWANQSHLLKDMGSPGVGISNDQFAVEWNHGYTFQQNSSSGDLFYKLPPIRFPFPENNELILGLGQKVHTDEELSVPLEAALASGSLDPAKIMANSKPANCQNDTQKATFHIEGPRDGGENIVIGELATVIENNTCIWKLKGDGPYLKFPQYLDKDLKPADMSKVPAALINQTFPLDKDIFSRVFNGLGNATQTCYTSPGPADPKLHCAHSKVNGYWLAYRWYKFVDQPALQRQHLSAAQRAFLQHRIEVLHDMLGPVSRWLKPGIATPGTDLAHVDPVALVSPPPGLETGYVPIAMYEGPTMPSECANSDELLA